MSSYFCLTLKEGALVGDLLYQRLGVAVNRLAQDFLSRKVGDRIPPISEYQEMLQVSRGTVQNSLNYLKEKGAISLVSRGHLGTFIEKMDHRCLQECSFRKELLGAMPLPYSACYQGLATALYKVLSPLSFNLVYARGAESRLRLIASGVCQFVVCSRYAVQAAVDDGQNVEIVADLGAGSYLSRHVLVMRDAGAKRITSGMRVAYDRASLDQRHLTELACAGVEDVQFVEIYAHQTIAAIRSGQIDAGVWNLDEILESGYEDLHLIPMDDIVDVSPFTSAVVVIEKNDTATAKLLQCYLDVAELTRIQEGVKQGKIRADY